MPETITIKTIINAPVSKVWDLYTDQNHVVNWNTASDDWHTVSAENDLSVGGNFNYRMEAKDGSEGFNFEGAYDEVLTNEKIVYTMADNRHATVLFDETDENTTAITVTFEAEDQNPIEMQEFGWQSILNNFKDYVESSL